MKRQVVSACILTLIFVTQAAGAEPTACPWKFVTGDFVLSDETGYSAEINWKQSAGGAIVGTYKDKDGEATELIGWQPAEKVISAYGFGDSGAYWKLVFTTVTAEKVVGEIVDHRSDGTTYKGKWTVTRESDDLFPTLFDGVDGDGNKVTIKGSFKRKK
jgi:hypothetical protein